MTSVPMVETTINGRWTLRLPVHRADRPEWPWWEATRLAHMHHLLGAGGHVVYDVGSEEGDFPALWASWGNRVALWEPNERVWPNVRAIWEANDLGVPLASFVGFAANENSPVANLYTDRWPPCADGPIIGDHGFANLCERPDIQRRSIDVVATAVTPPTAITIDCEGSEYRVLLGADRTLREHRPLVWVSVHPQFMSDMYGDTPEMLFAYMDRLGYERRLLSADHEEHHVFTPRERS